MTEVFVEGLDVLVIIAAPMLLACILVGTITSLLQVVFNVQEQAIVFLVKAVAVIVVLYLNMASMGEEIRRLLVRSIDAVTQ